MFVQPSILYLASPPRPVPWLRGSISCARSFSSTAAGVFKHSV